MLLRCRRGTGRGEREFVGDGGECRGRVAGGGGCRCARSRRRPGRRPRRGCASGVGGRRRSFCNSEKNDSIAAVTGRGDPADRPGQPVRLQRRPVGPGAELRPAVRVDHDGAVRAAAGDRGAQRGHRECGGHAFAGGVADDPVGEHVLDRAAVELPLDRRVFGDVGEPHPVGCRRGEHSLHQVVVHRRAGRLPAATPPLLRGRRPDALVAAEPPHPALTDVVASGLEFVGDEPVAELRVVGVRVDDRVRHVRVGPVPIADRLGAPGVERRRSRA